MSADEVPLIVASKRLSLSVRTLSVAKRRALGLVDAPTPPGGAAHRWVTRESLERVAEQRAAIRQALREKPQRK